MEFFRILSREFKRKLVITMENYSWTTPIVKMVFLDLYTIRFIYTRIYIHYNKYFIKK